MKDTYIVPSARVLALLSQGILCASSDDYPAAYGEDPDEDDF